MQLNDPAIVAEVTEAFERYEAALIANDVAVLDELFLDDPTTLRYGIGENLYGIEEIRAFRARRASAGLDRRLDRTQINAYGTDCGVAATLFYRGAAPGKVGRQMQTWIRTPAGWRVAAAHVSMIDEPESA
jgi:hypothetical protein